MINRIINLIIPFLIFIFLAYINYKSYIRNFNKQFQKNKKSEGLRK
jgi:uncharacterized membrane protein YkvI